MEVIFLFYIVFMVSVNLFYCFVTFFVIHAVF